MRLFSYFLILTMSVWLIACETIPVDSSEASSLQSLKSAFIDQRFGMFICYNIMSYGANWGEANYPIDGFNPRELDAQQWANAAISANMKFGLLTAKHHEGFCLWDSKYTEYDVAGTPYRKDIVRQFVDAFRSHGLGVGLYFSIWDSTHEIDRGQITPEKLTIVKGQISELLTQYGQIDYFVIDGWFWRMGHREDVQYQEIRDLIKSLQPHCLITEHTHIQAPYHADIPYFEGPFGAFPQEGNTMASALGHCSIQGNGWFWGERTPTGMKRNDGVDSILTKLRACEERYCNFMLNCMPNRQGLLDTIYLDLLADIGQKWSPNENRLPLPDQGPAIGKSVPILDARASSGHADFLIESAKIGGKNYYDWEAEPGFPQNIVLDLGVEHQAVDLLTIVHKHRCKPFPEQALPDGNILRVIVSVSSDGLHFEEIAQERWTAPSSFRAVSFEATRQRFLKIEILDAVCGQAIINDLEVGLAG
ncbi:alpha-L-fucosidase [Pontibacter sp. G13]|uniref:alpha-L-fucosidase n=1 Tax=Pontibacter sp. G13 TaxID=3074898 RepID=UPI00288C5968|nr:alpha-L-fucosidase [Pontibacter sp. G13]WNJ19045.1 alpha-L-fucosidase [Pontibacter sp. G13]